MELDLEHLYNVIATQLKMCANQLNVDIDFADEQYFFSDKLDPNKMYFTIIFGESEYNGFMANIDVSISGISKAYDIKTIQDFLTFFSKNFTLQRSDSLGGTQIWGTPQAENHFNEVTNALRSSVQLLGTLTVATNGVFVKVKYKNQDVYMLTHSGALQNQTNPQAYNVTGGVAVSKVSLTVNTFTLQTYLDFNSQLVSDCDEAYLSHDPNVLQRVYDLTIIKNNKEVTGHFILHEYVFAGKLGTFDTVTLTFAEADMTD